MCDYNTRQYVRMLDQIHAFEVKQIDIEHLIKGLKFLLCALENADREWKSHFQDQWAVLEVVFATTLDKNEALTREDLKLVESAIQEMKQLLMQIIPHHSDDPER